LVHIKVGLEIVNTLFQELLLMSAPTATPFFYRRDYCGRVDVITVYTDDHRCGLIIMRKTQKSKEKVHLEKNIFVQEPARTRNVWPPVASCFHLWNDVERHYQKIFSMLFHFQKHNVKRML